jgi:hypothetical protein
MGPIPVSRICAAQSRLVAAAGVRLRRPFATMLERRWLDGAEEILNKKFFGSFFQKRTAFLLLAKKVSASF